MKANELRIGNLVGRFVGINDEGADYEKIKITSISESGEYSYIDSDTFVLVRNGLDALNGVELTQEWLLKLNFKKHDKWIWKLFISETMYIFVLLGLGNIEMGIDINNQKFYKSNKFVHQLQNLYFALTGEELTVNN